MASGHFSYHWMRAGNRFDIQIEPIVEVHLRMSAQRDFTAIVENADVQLQRCPRSHLSRAKQLV